MERRGGEKKARGRRGGKEGGGGLRAGRKEKGRGGLLMSKGAVKRLMAVMQAVMETVTVMVGVRHLFEVCGVMAGSGGGEGMKGGRRRRGGLSWAGALSRPTPPHPNPPRVEV